MKVTRTIFVAVLSMSLTTSSDSSGADRDLKDVLDFAARPRLLDTHLTRFGPSSARTVVKDSGGARIRLTGDKKSVGQTGMYSYFSLAGDFEVSVTYNLVQLQSPQGGYGASVGVVLDAEGTVGAVTLARGYHPTDGQGYWLSRSVPANGETKYSRQFFPSTSKHGRLALHRKGNTVMGMVADLPSEPLRELTTTPFTAGTVRQFRLYADNGGSPTVVDGRLTNLFVKAEEITGGIPEMESAGGWWRTAVGVIAAVGVALGGLVWFRRRKHKKCKIQS